MLKKIIFLLSLSVSIAFAAPSQEEVINAVKSNPALLNTPQAQAEMAKRGVNKSDVLSKINASNSSANTSAEITQLENTLEITENIDEDDLNTTLPKKQRINASLNPLLYQENNLILNETKKKQSIKENSSPKRYGLSFFKNKNSIDNNSMPVPSYYTLNNGDTISIWLYGAKNENFSLSIDNNGNINIPKYGPLHVAGKKFGEIEGFIQEKIKHSYSNTNAVVNISTYSTIQVNLVGDVEAPGAYNINALSTVKNLLIASQGVKKTGSLRDIIIKRDGKVIDSIDFYKLLQNGDESIGVILRANDTIFVPKATKIVSIDGEIHEPAQFELKPNETLQDLIKYASGIKSSASKYGLLVNRYVDHENVKTLEVDYENIKDFKLQNEDKVYVYAIDKVHKQSIYIYGNVVRPGEKELSEDGSLKQLFKDEISRLTLKGVFLEDTLFSYALIKSKTQSLEKKVSNFNLSDLLSGKIDIKLNNDDEVYIFNKYNSNMTPYVTIGGTPINKPGKYRYYQGIKVSDVLNQAGTSFYFENHNKIKITTYNTDDFMPNISIITANEADNFIMHPYDDIEVYDYYKQNHIKTINITGEVNFPNQYSLNENITLQKIVEIAGGFTPKAYKDYFEVIRYYIEDSKREKKLIKVPLEELNTFLLKEYDEISIHTIPNWSERKTVTVGGEVNFPGTYVIEDGDKLYNIIQRAGGYTDKAFIEAAVFTRESIKELQTKRQKQSILELKQKVLAISVSPEAVGQGESKVNLLEMTNIIDKISLEAQQLEPIGRISISLMQDLEEFNLSYSNISLKDKDALFIPSQTDTILIMGEVMSPTAIVYEGNNVNEYIAKAGGFSQRADEDLVYVIHADGSSQRVYQGWFTASETNIVKKGSTIVVPQELVTYSFMQITKDVASIFYQFALTAAAMNAVGAF